MQHVLQNLKLAFAILLFFCCWNNQQIQAQVGINNSSDAPDNSAMLDVKSSDKGFLTPRMTSAEREAISTPATGLLVYDTDENAFFFYNGTAWESMTYCYEDYADNQSDENPECEKILPDDGVADALFGTGLAMAGEYAIMGAPGDQTLGAAYIFKYIDGTWIQQTKLVPTDLVADDYFGAAVALTTNYAFVSASQQSNNRGVVYIFKRSDVDETWTEIDKITASDIQNNDKFGSSLDASDTQLIVGAPEADSDAGAVYIFKNINDSWFEQTKLVASDRADGDYFGISLTLSDDLAAIGSYLDEDNGTASGAVYVFEQSSNVWFERDKISGGEDDSLGVSVAFFNDLILAGAVGDSTGAIFAYEYDGMDWITTDTIRPSDGVEGDAFGSSLTASSDKMMVGTPQQNTGEVASGAAYLYEYDGANWTLGIKYEPSSPSVDLLFGTQVALSGDLFLVSTAADSENGNNAGAAFFYCPIKNDYLDNTDDQILTLTDTILSIENGNSIDLRSLSSDHQAIDHFALSGTVLQLSLENDNEEAQEVDLSSFFDNTDAQTLSLTDNVLSLSGGINTIDLSEYTDLSTHTATSSINTNEQWLSGDGDDEGISIDTEGAVTLATTTGDATINLIPPETSKNARLRFSDENENTLWNIGTSTSIGLFRFKDAVNNTVPVEINAGAPTNSLVVTADGRVGVGTSPTNAKFEVNGHADVAINNYTYLNNTNANTIHVDNNMDNKEISIYATERIIGKFMISMSDERIKKIQGSSDKQKDLNLLRQIKITDYQFIDQVKESGTQQKKVIAQQVAEVYPQAVNKQFTEVVPDIYQAANIDKDGWVNLKTDLKVGEKVKLIFEQEEKIMEVVEVKKDAFQVTPSVINRQSSAVFVYGRQVNDFHTVDYEALSMLNVSATQQLIKENESLQATIQAQQERLADLKKDLEQMGELEATLRALQQLQNVDN